MTQIKFDTAEDFPVNMLNELYNLSYWPKCFAFVQQLYGTRILSLSDRFGKCQETLLTFLQN